MIDISVVIISFNTKNLLTALLQSLKKAIKVCKEESYKVQTIIVDNHSQDGTLQAIKDRFVWVKLIENKKNVGFAKACNQGILKAKGELVLLLNSDTKIFPQTLLKMTKFMKDCPKVGAATCRVELPNGKIDPASHRGFPTPWNAFCYFSGLEGLFPKSKIFAGYHQGWRDLTKIHEIDACAGAFFLTRREVIDKVGLLDERYFMYGEDIDWAFRIKKAGFKIFYYPGTKIIHSKKKSGREKLFDSEINQDLAEEIKKISKRSFYETMRLFYRKHYKKKYPWIIQQLVFFGIWVVSKFKE